jgi:hypothetical protein
MPASFDDPFTSNLLYLHGGDTNQIHYSDLWVFNISSGWWGWLSGTSDTGSVGVYPPQKNVSYTNVFPSSRSRHFCVSDPLLTRSAYCFGGSGCNDSTCSIYGYFGDVWKYNIASNSWAWIWGSSTGVDFRYSLGLGVTGTANNPGSRNYPGGWSSSSQKAIYVFGGQDNNQKDLGDMWKFDVVTQRWTWIHGTSKLSDYLGSYVSQDFDSSNYPRCRYNFATSSLGSGTQETFVLYGGIVGDWFRANASMDDVWYYSPVMNQFRWVQGSSVYSGTEVLPVFGTKMVENIAVRPGSRRTGVILPLVRGNSFNSSFFVLFGGVRGAVNATYVDVMRLRAEIPCGFGYIQNTSSGVCSPCPNGQYLSTIAFTSSCSSCSPGKFANQTGSTQCLSCSAGTFSSAYGSSACDKCALLSIHFPWRPQPAVRVLMEQRVKQ